MAQRIVTIYANVLPADTIWAIWTLPELEAWIKQQLNNGGWNIQSAKIKLGNGGTYDLNISAFVDNAYTGAAVHDGLYNDLAAMNFYVPLYGDSPIFPMIYGISILTDAMQYAGGIDPYAQAGQNAENPNLPSTQPVRQQPSNIFNGNNNTNANQANANTYEGEFSDWLAKQKLPEAFDLSKWTLNNLGITTPTLLLTGALLVFVLPMLLPTRNGRK